MEERHGLDFNVCLLVDNCPAHPRSIMDHDPRVIVMFLPANTTSLIQPMDQGIIRNLKLNLHNHIYKDLIQSIDSTPLTKSTAAPVADFYKKLNILDCINYLGKSWEQVKDSTMINCWHKCLVENLIKPFPAWKALVKPVPLQKENRTLGESTQNTQGETVSKIEQENAEKLISLVESVNAGLGATTIEEMTDVLNYDDLDVSVQEVAEMVFEERERRQNNNDKDPHTTVKLLQKVLIEFNNLAITVKNELENSDCTENVIEKLEIASKPVKDKLNASYELFTQTKITNFIQRSQSAKSEAKEILKDLCDL